MVTPRLPVDQKIAEDIAAVLNEQSSISVKLIASGNARLPSNEALLDGSADIALMSNNQPHKSGITAVMPLYSNVLHILVRQEPAIAESLETLFTSGRVFAGPPGSPSRIMLTEFAVDRKIDVDDIRFVELDNDDDCPDVFAIFAPILRDLNARLDSCKGGASYRLWSLGSPEEIGTGSAVDAATLRDPSLRAFVIPVGVYGDVTPQPAVTLAVDKMLVARSDVSAATIYDLISEIVRLQPALAEREPILFHQLTGNINSTASTFVLHPGARSFIDRDEPSVYERYSGIAEVAVTVFIALFTGAIAGVRIYNMRRKNRIDKFYTEAIRLRKSVNAETPFASRQDVVTEVRMLQTRAFELLVDEKLAADESFRIFLTLSNDIIRDLGAAAAPDWSAADD